MTRVHLDISVSLSIHATQLAIPRAALVGTRGVLDVTE